MENYKNHLPSALLFAYIVYSAFVPVTIAHSLIAFSLALLAGYQSHISRSENTKHNKEVLEQLKNDFDSKLNGVKEAHEKKLSKLEDEVAKMALNTLPPKTASSSPLQKKMVF